VKLARPDLAALALVGLVIVCATVCAVLHVEAPAFLTSIALFVAGIGGGIALPTGQASTTSPRRPCRRRPPGRAARAAAGGAGRAHLRARDRRVPRRLPRAVNAPRIQDRRTEILVAASCLALGSWLMWDAYDGRGKRRPWALSLLPGL
jgi:hypothetical protein